jgi:glycosyltransferase involved in cell wall biosynthesis
VIRVSVIIPCYNREHLLCATLDSLRAQTYPDWEAIVVDDHSQDNSAGVAQRYACLDSRIRAISRRGDRKGGNICRNQGLSFAQGDYVIFLDSDDLLSQTCLEHRIAAMDSAPDCGFGVYQTELFTHVIGDRQVLWNAYTDSNDLHRFLSLDTVWITTGPIWRKQAVTQLGGFDENALSFQDWAIHVRALIAGIKYFKEPVRDNFHRFQYDQANTIYAVAGSHPDHLKSHEELFAKTVHDLQLAGLLDRETRWRAAGMFWWLTTRWRAQSNAQAADRVWDKTANLGLCSRRQYLEGCLILRLYSIRGGGRLARLIQQFCPPRYTRIFSQHLYNAPIGRAERGAAFSDPQRSEAPSHQPPVKSTSQPNACLPR